MLHLKQLFALAVLSLAAPYADAQKFSASIGGQREKVSWSATFGSGWRPHIGVSIGIGRGPSCSSKSIWVPGHYERVERSVWVEGRSHREWVPPTYATRYDDCGRPYQVIVRDGYWHEVCEPGHYETRYEEVWVPGYYRDVRY